jgi:SAM-dependent methyltransferase
MKTRSIKQMIKNSLPRSIVETLILLEHIGMRPPNYKVYVRYIEHKKGIEIGGPSTLFNTILPLYRKVEGLDGVNFSTNTLWEENIQGGRNYNYSGSRKGMQFISDATDLSQIDDNTYDFLLSSNCLEHIANPLKALMEWRRVIKPNGSLILVLPNKVSNFDHRRPTTTFDHILKDLNNDTAEDDLTHLEEILELHDLSLDPPAGDFEAFRKRSLDNFCNRALHHHIFDLSVIKSILDYLGFDLVEASVTYRDFFALATKASQNPPSSVGGLVS